jgi:hypothetical protein
MTQVVIPSKLRAALKRVRSKGSSGVDGMTVDDWPGYLRELDGNPRATARKGGRRGWRWMKSRRRRRRRYGLRSPFSQERLTRQDDGRVVHSAVPGHGAAG